MQQTKKNRSRISNEGIEQVELIDLFKQLWHEKYLIAAFAILSFILSTFYITLTKEKWTSSAIVTQPDMSQIVTYKNAINTIYGNSIPIISILDLQSKLINRFHSSCLALSNTLKNKTEPEKLKVYSDIKGKMLFLTITYQGNTPKKAQEKLTRYIQKIDKQITEDLDIDLKFSIKQQVIMLNNSLENQRKIAYEQKTLRIKQIIEALKFAQDAKIITPQMQSMQNITQDTMFLLGSRALTSMIRHETTRPLTYSSMYYQTKKKLLDIQNLKIDLDSMHVYHYVMRPNLPIYRDHPKKAFILVLSVVIGGMISSLYILIRNALYHINKSTKINE